MPAEPNASTTPAPTAVADPQQILADRIAQAIRRAFPDGLGEEAPDAMLTPSRQPQFGDFQSNAAMPLAKRLGLKPRDVAAKIVEHADLSGVAEPLTEQSIAGPGFINIRLRRDALAGALAAMDAADLGVVRPDRPETIVVDLCGVNLAKQMHVGHLRSTIIGDTIARTFERLGHRVIRQSHVGDWGLPIAMVVAKLRDEAEAGRIRLDELQLDDLDALYKQAQRESTPPYSMISTVTKYGANPKTLAELEAEALDAEEHLANAKATLVKLQNHDPATYKLWQHVFEITMRACVETTARLHADVTMDHAAGESSYSNELAPLVQDLESRGVAEHSEGALIVRSPGVVEPCLVRKSDGGFLYATTDLAAIRRRVQEMKADRVIYCVDARQSLHFRQVFGAALKAGYSVHPETGRPARLEHAAFGNVLGEDNRPLKTRSGENVRLSALLDEAVERAAKAVAQRNSELEPQERRRVAEAVGIAAIKYADLSSDRIKDYVFSFDRMLAFEGDTGPYLLYALVRTKQIFRRAEREGVAVDPAAPFAPEQPAEKTLALALLRYPDVLRQVAESLEPHRLCQYLFGVATNYSSFYEQCPVLKAPDEATRQSRLRLCALTARVLEDGLHTLGLPTVDRM